MQKQRHFLVRTFGKTWKWKFPLFIFLSLFLAFLPTILFIDKLEVNVPKFCEEWLKNILALSAIFLIVNYLNYQISLNRSKDKISMLVTNFSIAGEGVFNLIKTSFTSKNDILNLVNFLESLLKKIQSEDEFYYHIEGIGDFSNYKTFFEKLRNHINASQITTQQIEMLNFEFQKIRKYLSKYL